MGWTFPRDDSTPTLQCTERGTPHNFNIGGFPAGDPSWMDKIGQLWSGKRKWFYAKIHSVVGGNTYKVIELGAVVKGVAQVRGQLITAIWLKPRSYDPPMGVGTWVVATYDRDKRCVFTGKSTDANLGDVKSIYSAVIPTGWLLCNKANFDAGAVNGITPPIMVGRVQIGAGADTDQTLQANDTAYTYALGDTDGFNDHGAAANNHTSHENLSDHTHYGTTVGAGGHAHGTSALNTQAVDNADAVGQVTVIDSPAGSTDSDLGHEHTFTTAAANGITAEWDEDHSITDNRQPSFAVNYIIFVGV